VKSVIWLHQNEPEQLRLYDYKLSWSSPARRVPASFLKGIKTSTPGRCRELFASQRSWKQYGEAVRGLSDLCPTGAACRQVAFISQHHHRGTHDI